MKEIIQRVLTKLTSSKVLITIAAVVLLYIIVIGNKVEFKQVALALSAAVVSYMGVNAAQHYIDSKSDKDGTEEGK